MLTWTLFTFGNGDIIFSVFNSLQALIKSALFINLLNVVFLTGFAILIFSSVAQGRLPITYTIKYLLFTAIFIRCLLSFTITLGLVDCVNPAHNQVLTDVPFILGVPASVLSQVGHFLALEVDTFYNKATQSPPELGLTTGGGYNLSGTLIKDSLSYHFNDPYLEKSLSYFFMDCVIPLMSKGVISPYALLNSHSIWHLIESSHYYDAFMSVYYGSSHTKNLHPNGQVSTCRQIAQWINQDLQTKRNLISSKASTHTLQTVLNYITSKHHTAQDAKHYLQQSALISLLSHSTLSFMSTRTHSNLLTQHLSHLHTTTPIDSPSAQAAHVFQSAFGYLYAVLQVMVYAMVPLVVVFSCLPGLRSLLLKRYLQLLLWFPITLVLITIVNHVLLSWSAQLLGPVWQKAGGLTLMGRDDISESAYKLIEVGQWLMTLVPVVAWGIVSSFNGSIGALLNTLTAPLISPLDASNTHALPHTPVPPHNKHDLLPTGYSGAPSDIVALSSHPLSDTYDTTPSSLSSSLKSGSSTLSAHSAQEAMHSHWNILKKEHAIDLPSDVIETASAQAADAAEASIQSTQTAYLHGDQEKSLHAQAQSEHYLTEAFDYLSDHLGGGTQGKILAGGLLGVGLAAAGSAMIAALPEEAALAAGAGASTALEMVGEVASSIATRTTTLKQAATQGISSTLKGLAKLAEDDPIGTALHLTEGLEQVSSLYGEHHE